MFLILGFKFELYIWVMLDQIIEKFDAFLILEWAFVLKIVYRPKIMKDWFKKEPRHSLPSHHNGINAFKFQWIDGEL